MYFNTSLKTSRRDWSELMSPRSLFTFFLGKFFLTKKIFWRRGAFEGEEVEESDGVSSTQRAVGSDTVEVTVNTSVRTHVPRVDAGC
jgi:hypothetical protein